MNLAPYDQIAAQFAELRTRLMPREVEYLGWLLEGLKPGATVLDLGCGTGHPMASSIVENGFRIVGVDGSEQMLQRARERMPEQRWIHAALETVEFNETFDAAIIWDSMFHLPRRHHGPILRKVHGWLAPGGRLMVSSGGLAQDAEGFTDTMFGHEFFYDSLAPGEMVSTLEEIGFEIHRAEMCDQPDGGRNKGKWATLATREA